MPDSPNDSDIKTRIGRITIEQMINILRINFLSIYLVYQLIEDQSMSHQKFDPSYMYQKSLASIHMTAMLVAKFVDHYGLLKFLICLCQLD